MSILLDKGPCRPTEDPSVVCIVNTRLQKQLPIQNSPSCQLNNSGKQFVYSAITIYKSLGLVREQTIAKLHYLCTKEMGFVTLRGPVGQLNKARKVSPYSEERLFIVAAEVPLALQYG